MTVTVTKSTVSFSERMFDLSVQKKLFFMSVKSPDRHLTFPFNLWFNFCGRNYRQKVKYEIVSIEENSGLYRDRKNLVDFGSSNLKLRSFNGI